MPAWRDENGLDIYQRERVLKMSEEPGPVSFLLTLWAFCHLFGDVFFRNKSERPRTPGVFILLLVSVWIWSAPNHKVQVLLALSSLVNVLIIFISQLRLYKEGVISWLTRSLTLTKTFCIVPLITYKVQGKVWACERFAEKNTPRLDADGKDVFWYFLEGLCVV